MNNKKTAKILSLIAVLALVLTAVFAFGITASAETTEVDTVEVTDGDQLNAAMTGAEVTLSDGSKVTLKNGGTIILGADIYATWVNSYSCGLTDRTVTIKNAEGNSYTIYRGAQGQTATSIQKVLFYLTNSQVTLENVTLDGQAVDANGNAIIANTASGGAFYVTSASKLILNDGAVIQNFTAKNGGAIYSTGTVIINSGAKITSNSGTIGGGVYTTGTLVINGGAEISLNKVSGTSARGGGVAVYGGTTYMMGGTVKGNVNHDTSTSTTHVTYGGGFAVSGGTLYVYGGVIENNQITTATGTSNTKTQQGTAINLSNSGAVYLVGGTIRNNTADNSKGIALGFYSTPSMYIGVPTGVVSFPDGADTPTGDPFILDSTNNYPYELGKSSQIHLTSILPEGSRVYANGNPTIDCTTVAEDAFAGVVHNYASGVTMFYTAGTPVFENRYSVGGEIYNTYSAALAAAIEAKGTLTFTHDVIITSALGFNAGEYTVDGAGHSISLLPGKSSRVFATNAEADVTVINLKLVGNGTAITYNGAAIGVTADSTLTIGEGVVISGFSAKNGGAITVSGTLNMVGGTILDNTVTTDGGAIYVSTGATATVSGGEISGNTATSKGGAIYVSTGATATVNGGTIKSNNAANGAGIACDGTLNLSGGTISGNIATGYGGGLLIAGPDSGDSAQLNMTGGVISGNTAGSSSFGGGGIYFTSRGRGAITGGTISGNTATTKGGAIYFGGTSSATYTVSNVIVTGNNAATGAGIYVNSAALVTFESGEISDNHATNGGGAFVEGTLTVTGGTISENTATNNGGAISFTKALNINGGTISGNTAKNGGAISASGTLTMTSGTISGNTATGNGGGIYVASGKTATVSGGTVSENKAATGAGIACDGTLNLSGTALIQNNAAASFGGGLSIAGSSSAGTHGTLNMSGGTISGNTADAVSNTYGGGGIFFTSQGIGNITGGTIENNVAQHGAGIQARYLLTVTGATISGNHAKTAGAGIYVYGSAKVEIGEGTAIEKNIAAALNKAMYGGGAYVAAGGTLVMNGGRISGNVVSDYTASKDSRGAGVYTLGNFWMTGGEISGNTLVGTLGCGVFCGQGNFYMLGGEICDNVLARYASTNLPRGSALMFTTSAESAYLLGGTIEGNVIKDQVTFEQSESETVATPIIDRDDNDNVISITTFDGTKQYVVTLNETLFEGEGEFAREICIYAGNAKIYIGGSIEGATVPDAIVNNVNGVSVSESVVTSSNALVIPATEKGDTFGYVSGATAEQLILSGALAEGSRVVIPDNYSEEVAYAMTVADDTSIGCIFLGGADALYRPTVTEDGKLVWPKEEYQLYQSAALDQSISFRVAFARRDAKADILSDVTVEQITKAQNKETAAWESKAVNAEWKQDVYNGSPCIVVSLAPKMAMDQIIVKKGDVAVKDEGYTFASYLKAMKENELYSTDTELMALVDATLNYCAAAQNYFNYNNGTLANVGVDTIVGPIPEVTMSLNDPNKIFYRAQVDVASTVSVAIIAKGNVTATVTVGTTPITPEYQGLKDAEGEDYTAIVIPDLTAAALMQDITVEIGDASLTYSVPAYAYNMQEKSGDAELVSIVQALYAYAVAADAYAN